MESCNGKRILEWLDNPNRKPAHLSFTDGLERQIAYRFEALSNKHMYNNDVLITANSPQLKRTQNSLLAVDLDSGIAVTKTGIYKGDPTNTPD